MDCFVGLLMKETMKKKQQNRAYKKQGDSPLFLYGAFFECGQALILTYLAST